MAKIDMALLQDRKKDSIKKYLSKQLISRCIFSDYSICRNPLICAKNAAIYFAFQPYLERNVTPI